ncbi:hypothetical protein ARMSODRAFT_977323 [Armillaria solidipes]|uniref:Uncharacterized protein n=1 Tax=Armillaria solidipes TaxID=1076256 RepID=A0A2H3BAQ1_9AGAR|nr:hypothetical protein ARMSODRAFT_977323 [Armillaria solidipes]
MWELTKAQESVGLPLSEWTIHRCIHYKPRLNAEHFKDDHATPLLLLLRQSGAWVNNPVPYYMSFLTHFRKGRNIVSTHKGSIVVIEGPVRGLVCGPAPHQQLRRRNKANRDELL